MPNFIALDRLKADLDILRPLDKEQEARILQKFRLDWNYHSNAIEGNSLTLGETRSLLLHGLTAKGKPLRDHLDIRGHNDAVLALEDVVNSERPLTEQFIREMHQVLLGEPYDTPARTAEGLPTRKHITPGEYKRLPNNVRTATGEMFYFARPEETPARMADLVVWYRREEATPTLHPVALASEFHYRFVRIHPFDDGNGRMSRLLMNLILLRHGYSITVIKNDDRNRYLAALAAADTDDMEPFVDFITENVEASLQLMLRGARGESIEEPSDLDKRLALLRMQVFNRENPKPNAWGLDIQTKFYDTFIKLWFFDLVNQLKTYNSFFNYFQANCSLPSNTRATTSVNLQQTITEIANSVEGAFIHFCFKLEEVPFYFSWAGFKGPENSFALRLGVRLFFKELSFVIEYAVYGTMIPEQAFEWKPVFESPYEGVYDITEIQDLNHQLATKVLDYIEAKLDEPPTA